MNKNKLRFIALSGTISVTENLYLYEYGDDMMILDCGVGFPDLEMPGVDLVIPDFSYILQNKHKLRGIVVSQGHEDHIGAIPYLLKELNVPIWCAPLVNEFLKEKFEDVGIKDFKINIFNPDSDTFEVGVFKISPFRVTHSVPDTVGFAIDTPQGLVFHVPEHKMDQNPVDGMPFDTNRAKLLASGKKVLFLASDCLGANHPGFTPGELQIEENFYNIVKNAESGIFMTAISSNIGRFQQMINVAQRLSRKVVLVGRSVQNKIEAAYRLGYLKYLPGTIIDFKESLKYNKNKLVYIVAGCYGQVGSSLYRIATNEHEKIKITEGDMMVFSADPAPPYSKESEDFVIDKLFDLGVDVHYYDLKEGLYVSGHGKQEDIKSLINIVKPKYLIPIGGTTRYMHAYRKLAMTIGYPKEDVFMLRPGESVVFDQESAVRGQKITTKEVLVHGLGIGDIGKVVLGDRSVLGTEGVVVPVIKLSKGRIDKNIEIISKGFVYENISQKLILDTKNKLFNELIKNVKGQNVGSKQIKDVVIRFLSNHFYRMTKREPMILPVVVEV